MSPDEIVQKWGESKTHREKAHLEQELRDKMGAKSIELVHILPGVSQYELTSRTRLLLSGSESVWKLVDDEAVEIGTVKRVLIRAEKVAAAKDMPLDEAVITEFEESQRGPRQVSNTARSWSLIRESVLSILKKDLSSVHEMERQAVADEVTVELDVFIRQLRSKVRARSKSGIPKDFGSRPPAEVKADRRQFCADMRELGLDPPKPGRTPDMDVVRRTHRRVSADHHPDRRKEPEAVEKFHRVNQAYQRILKFVESMKGTEE